MRKTMFVSRDIGGDGCFSERFLHTREYERNSSGEASAAVNDRQGCGDKFAQLSAFHLAATKKPGCHTQGFRYMFPSNNLAIHLHVQNLEGRLTRLHLENTQHLGARYLCKCRVNLHHLLTVHILQMSGGNGGNLG